MLYVIIASLVGITTAIPTQPGCCVPPQWEGVQVDALGIVVGGSATVSDSRVFISYDEPNNRILTHYYITTDGDKWSYKVLQDFNKGIRYVLFNDDVTCQPKPLPGPFKKQCIPADAVSQGNVKLGVGDHTLEGVSFQFTVNNTVTTVVGTLEDCVPIFESLRGSTNGAPSMHSIGYVDVSFGIKDPSVFDLPSSCRQNTPLG